MSTKPLERHNLASYAIDYGLAPQQRNAFYTTLRRVNMTDDGKEWWETLADIVTLTVSPSTDAWDALRA